MSNTETARAAARAALTAYQSQEGLGGNGDAADLVDLIADLMHLADTFTGDEETSGEFCAEEAIGHYNAEDTEGGLLAFKPGEVWLDNETGEFSTEPGDMPYDHRTDPAESTPRSQ